MAVGARPRRPGRASARDAVLAATASLMGERSLDSLTVADLLDRSGVSRTGFYYHFASKTDVLAALLDDVADELEARLAACGRPRPRSDRWLRDALDAVFGVWGERRPVVLAAQSAARAQSELGDRWRALVQQRWVQPLGAWLDAQQAAGRIAASGDPAALAQVLVGASEQALYAFATGTKRAPDPTAVAALAQIWAASLAPPPPT